MINPELALAAAAVVDNFVDLPYKSMADLNPEMMNASAEGANTGGEAAGIKIDLSATLGASAQNLDLTKTAGIVGLGLHQVVTDNLNNAVGQINQFANKILTKAAQAAGQV